MDLAKIENDKLVLRNEVCNLLDLVEETMGMFANDCKEKYIALSLHMNLPRSTNNKVIPFLQSPFYMEMKKQMLLTLDAIKQGQEWACDHCPIQIVTDKLRLRQILMTLISNAVKFTGRGGKVSVSVAQRRVCFISKELSERYFRKNLMRSEFSGGQEATAECFVNTMVACDVADARNSGGEEQKMEKGMVVMEKVFWRKRHDGGGTSQKRERRRRGMKLGLNERSFPEPKAVAGGWKGQNKYFHLVDDYQHQHHHHEHSDEQCEQHEFVHIVVKDSGRGIPETLQRTIFEPFVQVTA